MLDPSARLGGAEGVLLCLAEGLPRHGIDPTVLCLRDGPLVQRLIGAGVSVSVHVAGRLREPRKLVRNARFLYGAMAPGRFDAVYSNLSWAQAQVAFPAKLRGLPNVWYQANTPSPASWLDRLATALPATEIVAASSASVEAQQRLGTTPVRLIHPGINPARFRRSPDPQLRSRWGLPAEAPLVTILGRLQDWKGQREFLLAAAKLAGRFPDVRFAVVGGALLGWEGTYPEDLKRLAHDLRIEDRVIFTGHSDEVLAWLSDSDVVVNASDPEPFGLVVIEAMAAGCAVVAVDSGGPRDIISHRVDGLLCKTRDPGELADAVGQLLANSAWRYEIAERGRLKVESDFTAELMISRFADLIHETVSHRRRAVVTLPAVGN